MEGAIFSILTLHALVGMGESLKCYECFGHNSTQCYNLTNPTALQPVDCRHSSYIINNHDSLTYQCVAYLEIYNKTCIVGRHCVVKTNQKFCQEYRSLRSVDGFIVKKCIACAEDGCNSSKSGGRRKDSTFTILFWVVALLPLVTFIACVFLRGCSRVHARCRKNKDIKFENNVTSQQLS